MVFQRYCRCQIPDVSSDLLHVTQRIFEGHRNGASTEISVASFVTTVDQITSLLKFDRKEECRRHVDALHLNALLIRTTRSDLLRFEKSIEVSSSGLPLPSAVRLALPERHF